MKPSEHGITFVHVFPQYHKGTRVSHDITGGSQCWCEPMVLASFFPNTKPRTSIFICVHQTDELDLHIVTDAKVG